MAVPGSLWRSLQTTSTFSHHNKVQQCRGVFVSNSSRLHTGTRAATPRSRGIRHSLTTHTISTPTPAWARKSEVGRFSYSTVVVHNQSRHRGRRAVSFILISCLSFGFGAYFAIHYAPPVLTKAVMGSHIPSDEESLTLYEPADEFAREVDEHIKNCSLAQSLRNDPAWRESRPQMKIPESVRQHNLTAGTLSGPGMIVVPPYYFNKKDGSEMVQIMYVGTDVSGHPGIVHGGFIATMLDEGLARCVFPAMQNGVGVTANLQINYRKPTMAGQFLVLRARTVKVEGRKAWSEGWIESLEVAEGETPEKLVEAEALFIEPKYAKALKSLYQAPT